MTAASGITEQIPEPEPASVLHLQARTAEPMHRVREAFRLGIRATLKSDPSFFLGARERFRAPFSSLYFRHLN